ncbi:RNA polymerase sigma factor [Enterococcus sp. 669A]|uniref:RNA polymerase sigma factor n=1 Tax=Candidatus Enterococcus moelleringii TaxID=2815325 RepID=A0ABS3LDB3_9ENTE|nr:RNA polymerase sigma factor [Enterococcus sp. 669A]MBO1307080.1 RNA polymerase sigma factor [Enterococcus sp. 669A]
MPKNEKINQLIDEAISGNRDSLETLLIDVQDLIFNLSLRMLGTIPDAEDATQDILAKVITNLATFRKESNFQTWVYRLAINYLIDYKKSMFTQYPLDFDYYSNDIKAGYIENSEDLLEGISQEILAQELKMSCTNVLLQCLDPTTRCIFLLGTMFKVDSRIAGEILDMTPENYRQKLSRARKKVGEFLSVHCGLTETGFCSCEKRVGYAIQNNRLNPKNLEYQSLKSISPETLTEYMETIQQLDDLSAVFSELPAYQSNISAKEFIDKLFHSSNMHKIRSFQGGTP